MNRDEKRQQAFTQAKERMLKRGEHSPIVTVLTANEGYTLSLPKAYMHLWNDDSLGRKQALALLGRAFALKECETIEAIQTLFFIQEVWFVERTPEQEAISPTRSASQQPDRREMLLLLELEADITPYKQTAYRCEIIRPGGYINLAPEEVLEDAQSDLLTSFLLGVKSAPESSKVFQQQLERMEHFEPTRDHR